MGFLKNLFSPEKRVVDKIRKKAYEIDALKDEYRALSDEQLKAKTQEFRNRLANGETLDDILVEAFATSREACYRVRNEFPYIVQLMGALVLHGGDIAEMKTGEGKTLTSVMCVYLNALTQKGVHVVTVNEYLAERDARLMGEVHEFLGISVAVNLRQLTHAGKRAAYNADVTYTTNSELGFDYLRDNMVNDVSERVMRGLNYAIVDEADSILIDESRTPLIISGGQRQTRNLYVQADRFVKTLKQNDYEIDIKTKQILLAPSGIEKCERVFKINNLYDLDNTNLVHHINKALYANYIMSNNVEYVVQDDEIVIVDTFTGRTMPGRAFSDGLHQALEAKEGVTIKEETSTLATITYQNFFRLYDKLSGMTGTAKTEEEEFLSIYNMRVLEIETNVPIQRQDLADFVYGTKEAKYKAIVEEIKRVHETGQPVLVGTISVEISELISELLKKEKIRHEVLNAKNHAREAEIITNAGQVGAVTIATNMAGRGTDIKLSAESKALGGLAVIGTERHESRRIDNQLRGRSGRQGDPGFSRFYVSLDDELLVRFGGDRLKSLFSGGMLLESKILTNQITSAQKKVEGQNFDIRKTLIDYDDVLRRQREVVYQLRDQILENNEVNVLLLDMYKRVIRDIVAKNTQNNSVDEEGIANAAEFLGLSKSDIMDQIHQLQDEELVEFLANKSFESLEIRVEKVKEAFEPYKKSIILQNIDRNWQEHIDTMTKLREGIHLRSYAQSNPLQTYVHEGYELFENMIQTIDKDVVGILGRIQVRESEEA